VRLVGVLLVSQPVGLALLTALALARGEHRLGTLGATYAALAGIAGAIGLAAFYRGLAIGTMGIVAPISAVTPLVPLVVGLGRGERPGAVQGAGIVLALAGIAVVSREPSGPERRSRIAAGALLGLLAALCFGSALLALDAASSRDPYWAPLALRLASTGVVCSWFAAYRPRLEVPRSLLPALVIVGLLDAGGTCLFAVASTRGLISVVSVLASLYPVMIVLLARVVLNERLARIQLAGAAAALSGAAMISAG
jgi:drug/metabolite transporter (DMT)-like permease